MNEVVSEDNRQIEEHRKLKKQQGFTAIEMMIVIGLIVLLLIGAAKNIAPLQVEWKVYQLSSQASTVHGAARSWAGGSIYTGVSMTELKDDYLPEEMADGTGKNPFGGNITATANADPYNLDIGFTNVRNDVGARAVKKYGATYAKYDKASKVLTLTMQG